MKRALPKVVTAAIARGDQSGACAAFAKQGSGRRLAVAGPSAVARAADRAPARRFRLRRSFLRARSGEAR